MARAKEFDPEVVLQRAMELFWRQGFEATTMAELVEHLGIGRASLYATFGDKHELFLQALQHYLRVRRPDPVEAVSQPGPVLPAVRGLVRAYVDEALADPLQQGCMIVNSAGELLPGDTAVARIVESGWESLETALTSALLRARGQHELAADKDPRGLARFLLVFLQGVRLVGKGSPDPRRLRDAADQALSILD